jgi:drug/metabolite transporter (DMT)-like permease
VTEAWAFALVAAAAFVGSFGSVYLKKGANKLSRDWRMLLANWEIVLGLFIYGLSTVFYVVGVRGGELSVLFPIVSTGYAWTSILSVKLLGERMNRMKWAGIAFILFGVSLIGLGS